MMLLPSLSSAAFSSSLIFFLAFLPSHCQQSEGSACTVDNAPGVCTILPKCTTVYNELLAGKPPSKICGFVGFDPIVCCPTNAPVTTTARTITEGPLEDSERRVLSRTKCARYVKEVYYIADSPALSGNKKPVNISLCNIKTRKLIVGGKKSDPKEFPHMAAIGYNGGNSGILWLCGGTLVSERFVLTAAHCTYSPDWGNAAWVRLGDLNLVRDDDGAKPQNYRVAQRIRHPRYKRPAEYHDIALLKLESDVEFNAWIRPACLPYSLPDVTDDSTAIATGWGRVDWAEEQGSNDLLKVTLNLVPQPQCNASFFSGSTDSKLKLGIVREWQICAGGVGKDTCQGDSGGPLSIYNNDYKCMYTVVGVTSLGRLCGSIIPGVYTRVYHYVPWIESVVWPDVA